MRPIIYAPHHSLGKDNLGMSSFAWSKEAIDRLRSRHSDRRWVLKPHPGMRSSVIRNGVMDTAEYDEYLASWSEREMSTVFDQGEYFELFRRSAALITCSGSFLAEYLPTGKPIIHLDSGRSVGFNDVGERLSRGFYKAASAEELGEVFEDVVIRGNDPLKAVREELAREVLPHSGSASQRIVDDLIEVFFG